MHFQRYPGQDKLVSVIEGKIFDVVVDLRKQSPSFGKWEGVILDAEEHKQLFIPNGFAHGFCVLGNKGAWVHYKVSSLYEEKEEKTFRYDDPEIAICWPLSSPILSERDRNSPLFKEALL